jgi:putative Mg2+ transporter-C (MgtC) family protein
MDILFSQDGINILLRLLFAVVLGGLIGMERGAHGRPAGFRTHILVCLGATMAALLPDLFQLGENGGPLLDRARIVSGVVTGIGFLGAGAIIRLGDLVRGLTTAAGIWFTAVLGVLIGSGFFWLAVICAAVSLLVLVVFDKINNVLPPKVYRHVKVCAGAAGYESIETKATDVLKKNEVVVQELFQEWYKDEAEIIITYQVKSRDLLKSGHVVRALSEIPGIKWIKWE